MKIVWKLTGDFLDLEPVRQDLAEYWVDALDQDNQNDFRLVSSNFDPSWLTDLQQHIAIVHDQLINKFRIDSFEPFVQADLLDQDILNSLHRAWVGVLESHAMVPTLLGNIDPINLVHWNQINKKLHHIEEHIGCIYHSPSPSWEVNNTFGPDILNFNQSQIRIRFSQKGRSTFNKWLNRDFNMHDIDTNDFLQIGGQVRISLDQELLQDPPKNYVAFCQQNRMPVIGNSLNLANFRQGESRLTQIRHVFTRNIMHENNTALFEF
jgi:hypothetical protein